MTWWQAVLAYVIGPAVVAVGTIYAARTASKGSTAAAETTAEVSKDATAVDGLDRLVHNLETRLGAVEREATDLKSRVRDLERQRTRDRSLIRALYEYAARLRAALIDAEVSPLPEPPAGVDLDEPLPH